MNLKKANEILTGWKNVIFKDKTVEEMATKRVIICSDCPYNKHSICSQCGCPLAAKTRSPESKCPEGKW